LVVNVTLNGRIFHFDLGGRWRRERYARGTPPLNIFLDFRKSLHGRWKRQFMLLGKTAGSVNSRAHRTEFELFEGGR
jgi:hypothetical protein